MESSLSCHSSVFCCHYSSEIGAGMKLQEEDTPQVTAHSKSASLLSQRTTVCWPSFSSLHQIMTFLQETFTDSQVGPLRVSPCTTT